MAWQHIRINASLFVKMLRIVERKKYEVVFISARLPSHCRGVIGELKRRLSV
jgi:hypothetical protein